MYYSTVIARNYERRQKKQGRSTKFPHKRKIPPTFCSLTGPKETKTLNTRIIDEQPRRIINSIRVWKSDRAEW